MSFNYGIVQSYEVTLETVSVCTRGTTEDLKQSLEFTYVRFNISIYTMG